MTNEAMMRSNDMLTSSIEDICRFSPTTTEIMSEIFSQYEFVLGNEIMTPYEVFMNNSFLPVLSHIACMQVHSVFGLPMLVEQTENDDAIMGVEVNSAFSSLSSMLLYLVHVMRVSYDIFGTTPGRIILDPLYEWSTDETLQQKGLPYLGVSH
jgi:hypothetical protein